MQNSHQNVLESHLNVRQSAYTSEVSHKKLSLLYVVKICIAIHQQNALKFTKNLYKNKKFSAAELSSSTQKKVCLPQRKKCSIRKVYE